VGFIKLQDTLTIVSTMLGTPDAPQAISCAKIETIIRANIFSRPQIDLLTCILAPNAATAFKNQLMLDVFKKSI
jgi:hypothetical protein